MSGMNKRKKKKRNRDNRKKYVRQNKEYEENTKEEKETKKTENGILKVVKMEDTTMVKRKLVFCSQRNKQTNGMKKRKVLWEEKENDERERGPEIKIKELRQR